jgi:hypothetical protein
VSERSRKVILELAVEREFLRIKDTEGRGAEAIKGFMRFIAAKPELGNSVSGASGFSCRPFHTDSGSYLILYKYDAHSVTCIAVRNVPSPRDTYY